MEKITVLILKDLKEIHLKKVFSFFNMHIFFLTKNLHSEGNQHFN